MGGPIPELLDHQNAEAKKSQCVLGHSRNILYDDVPEGILALGLPYAIEIDVIIDYLEVSIVAGVLCSA